MGKARLSLGYGCLCSSAGGVDGFHIYSILLSVQTLKTWSHPTWYGMAQKATSTHEFELTPTNPPHQVVTGALHGQTLDKTKSSSLRLTRELIGEPNQMNCRLCLGGVFVATIHSTISRPNSTERGGILIDIPPVHSLCVPSRSAPAMGTLE